MAFIALLMNVSSSFSQTDSESVYALSDQLVQPNSKVVKGSEVITLLKETKDELSSDITVHLRHLLYENTSDSGSDYSFSRLLIKSGNKIAYVFDYGTNPSYKIIKVGPHKSALVLLGGYSHDGRCLIFSVENHKLVQASSYVFEGINFEDIDNDGIEEIFLSDSHLFLIPKGALSNSAGISIVLKYAESADRFEYSPRLIKLKYENQLSASTIKCDLDNGTKVEDCSKVIGDVIAKTHSGSFREASKLIHENMLFHDENDRLEFIDEYSSWFFRTQFASDFTKSSGIISPEELAKTLIGNTQ